VEKKGGGNADDGDDVDGLPVELQRLLGEIP
jgi:hypothetical protein